MKRIAVLQSNYLPWKGYFDIIHDVDLFIFYDDVQYTKNDWRNRNRVKTPAGLSWLTIPVGTDEHRLICDVRLTDGRWQKKHWTTMSQCYSRTPYFSRYGDFFEDAYLKQQWDSLSVLNQYLITYIARECLGTGTAFADSRTYTLSGRRLQRLLDLCVKAGATHYLSGPSAKTYIDPAAFERAGVALEWKSYEGYPEYPQQFPPFRHDVSIVDLLFNVGPAAPDYIWGWRQA